MCGFCGFCLLCRMMSDPSLSAQQVSQHASEGSPADPERVAALLQALRFQRDLYPHLSDEEFGRLECLLVGFHDVFALSDDVIGCVPEEKGVFHRVPTLPDMKPVYRRGYSMSMHERLALKVELQRLLRLGVIRPSQSPWMSPVVMVPKPNGKLRLTCDFRGINKGTVADPYPLPTVDEMLAAMAGSSLWSQIDAVSGFWQIPVHPEDIPKCGFTTCFGNYEWVRMPMGMVSSPATYQRLMDQMLDGVEGARTYVDDTFVYSSDFDRQLASLRQVLAKVREYKLLLQPSKCSFCVQRVVCLGHVLDANGIRPVESKVQAVLDLPLPDSVKALKGFLGMAGYYRKFIPNFAHLAASLVEMQKRGVAFEWNLERVAAVDAIKQALVSAPCLAAPRWDSEFILTTDWSCAAVGAVLSQVDPVTGLEHPIAFASRALTAAERNYAPTEGECLAVKWAVEKFRYYLHGRKFRLRVDHQALVWLDSARFTNSKLERWALALQEYDYVVEYIKGETNVVADHLSRAHSALVVRCAYAQAKVPCVPRRQRQAMQALVPLARACAAWPERAAKQSDLDSVPCEVCGHAGGFDNMAICSGCDKCFHLRCVVPAMSTIPSGEWFCSGCDVLFSNSLEELRDESTVLCYHSGDPYVDNELLAYVRGGHSDAVLASLAPARQRPVQRRGQRMRVHPKLPEWLSVRRVVGGQDKWRACPPLEYRWDLIRVMHDALGHGGVNQTLACLRQSFHWPGMLADVSMFVRVCDSCQRRKLVMPEAPPLQEPVVRGPFEHVHVDLCGPFDTPVVDVHGRISIPETPLKAHVVVIVDYFTKAAEFAVIYDKSPASVAKAFYYAWVCRYFVPSHVTSDNGAEFEAEFVHLLQRLGITHVHTSAVHPAANGAVERVVKSFKSMLRAHVNAHPEHWLQSVAVVRMQYWSRLHTALGVSPHEMVFGRRPVHVVPLANLFTMAGQRVPVVSAVPDTCAHPLLHVQQLQQQLLERDAAVFERIRAQFRRNAAHWPSRFDSRRPAGLQEQLRVGDWVLELVAGPVPSLQSRVKGPFKIVDFGGPGGQIAVLQTGRTEFKEARQFRRHVSTLAKYTAKHHLLAP